MSKFFVRDLALTSMPQERFLASIAVFATSAFLSGCPGSSGSFQWISSQASSSANSSTTSGSGTTSSSNTNAATAAGAQVLSLTLSSTTTHTTSCSTLTITNNVSGSSSNVTSAFNLSLSATSGTTFYSDSGCTQSISQSSIASGTSSSVVYYRDTVSGSGTITVSDMSGVRSSASQSFTNQAGTPANLVIAGTSSYKLNACIPYTISVTDVYSNVSVVSGAAVAINLTGNGSGSFYSDAHCATAISAVTISVGSSTSTYYFKDATTGSLTLSANSSGLNSGNLAVSAINWFSATISYALSGGGYGGAIAAADLSQDGFPDLVVTKVSGSYGVDVLINQQTGQFGNASNVSTSNQTTAMTIGAFETSNNSYLDMIAIGSSLVPQLFAGNGAGGLSSASGILSLINLSGIAKGDFNSDGKLDFATGYPTSHGVYIYKGAGTGSFTQGGPYSTGSVSLPANLAAGDLHHYNYSGSLDLVVSDYQAYGNLVVLPGNGDGSFGTAVSYGSSALSYPSHIALGDFNGDGYLDAAVTLAGSGVNAVMVSLNAANGTGAFNSSTNYSAGTSPTGVVAADFNGDGYLDLAVANPSGVSLLAGDGLGHFTTSGSVAVSGSSELAYGDFNKGGKPWLAISNSSSYVYVAQPN